MGLSCAKHFTMPSAILLCVPEGFSEVPLKKVNPFVTGEAEATKSATGWRWNVEARPGQSARASLQMLLHLCMYGHVHLSI